MLILNSSKSLVYTSCHYTIHVTDVQIALATGGFASSTTALGAQPALHTERRSVPNRPKKEAAPRCGTPLGGNGLCLGCFVDLHDLVATDALEEQEEQKVDRGHGGRDVSIRLQRGAVTSLVGFDDSLLLRGLFLGFLGGGQLGAIETEDLGRLQVKEGARRGVRVCWSLINL